MTISDPADPADPADALEPGDVVAALRADVEAIVAFERTIRAAQAEQLRLIGRAHGYAHAVEGVHDGSSSSERELATRAFIAELATALVVPEAAASGLVADAGIAGRHPATLDALGCGSISFPQARSIFDAVIGLPGDAAAALEQAALERAPEQTNPALRRRLRSLRERLHPEPLDARHLAATTERRIVLEPAPDGMAWLSLYLQAERAHAIKDRLDTMAELPADHDDVGAADGRTHAQRVLDAAADLLLTGSRTDHDGRPVDGDAAILPRILVTVPVLTLLGHTDEPAELDGYGPIDADTARSLAGNARSWQRILTHPETGAYLSYGRTTYRVPADLAGYLRAHDGGWRFPGCGRRATGCDLDHTIDWSPAGRTDHDNLAHSAASIIASNTEHDGASPKNPTASSAGPHPPAATSAPNPRTPSSTHPPHMRVPKKAQQPNGTTTPPDRRLPTHGARSAAHSTTRGSGVAGRFGGRVCQESGARRW